MYPTICKVPRKNSRQSSSALTTELIRYAVLGFALFTTVTTKAES